jgi:phage FluMu protein gp41
MYSDINQLCETFKELSREDYYNAIVALEKVRLTNVREALQYYKTMDALRTEYLGERRAIIGEKNLEEFRHFRLKQSKNMRAP